MSTALTIEHGPHEGLERAELRRRLSGMVELLQLKKKEISFVLTNDKRIHELNRVYRRKDKPTDVLAFAMNEGAFGALAGVVLGDVIVSVETARKQANSRRASVLEEVTMLFAHGLLHLLGWDHETPAKDRLMRRETERLCEAARQTSTAKRAIKRAAKAPAAKRPQRAAAKRRATKRATK